MLFWVIVKVGIRSLLANKLRSLLAMLGIIIGVGAVISMLAIGAGAKQSVLSRISAMGSNLLIVRPGQSGSHGVASGTQQNLTLADAEAVLAEAKGIRRIAPVVNGNAQVKYLNRNSRSNVTGTSSTWLGIRDFSIDKGRSFTEQEVENGSWVAVIGPVTAQNLLGFNDPVGEVIKVKGMSFTVIGVLTAKGDQGWFNPDDQVIVPYTVAMKQLFGQDYLREIDIQAQDGFDLTALQNEVTAVLRKRHRIPEDGDLDFEIRNQADMIRATTDITKTFTYLLGGIASISLLVGGIGIMNIMLVTVTERTREIGVRMAIGAKRSNIRTQFLIESMILSGLGGLLGSVAGVLGAKIIAAASPFPAAVEWSGVLLAISFSAMVGIFFGWYPARRAAALDPIESLRYE
jgi:putative ABC transport system permease protein